VWHEKPPNTSLRTLYELTDGPMSRMRVGEEITLIRQ
jgi:hypothetical protein